MLPLSAPDGRLYSGSVRALGLLLAIAALGAVACGGERSTQDTTQAPPTETERPPVDESRPPAPTIQGTTLDGETVSLADFRGRPVLVNVWSSW
jgi:hypothetical protein